MRCCAPVRRAREQGEFLAIFRSAKMPLGGWRCRDGGWACGLELGCESVLKFSLSSDRGEPSTCIAPSTPDGSEVALKVISDGAALDPERLQRFEQEARLAGSLNHPNLVVVHDVGSEGGAPFLVAPA